LPPDDSDDFTGLPGFRTWRSIYALVLAAFAAVVVLLTLFTRTFS
jgi:hypothetical protein